MLLRFPSASGYNGAVSVPPPCPPTQAIRVACLEDYAPMRESLSKILSHSERFRLVGCVATLPHLLQALEVQRADVVLMDLQLGGAMDGIRATAEVRARFPSTMVLVLTLYDQPDVVFDALGAGAVGYLLKSATAEAILGAIEEVAAGGAPMTGSIARMVIERLHRVGLAAPASPVPGPTKAGPASVEPSEADDLLSLREIEVLGALATGCRYKEVAAKLGVSHNTIRSHVRRIYEKLHAHGVVEAARKARDAGVRLPG